jgi:hypothetical protein
MGSYGCGKPRIDGVAYATEEVAAPRSLEASGLAASDVTLSHAPHIRNKRIRPATMEALPGRSLVRSTRYPVSMLRRFLYLDTNALLAYVSALEDGVRDSLARKTVRGGKAEGSLDVKIAKGGVGRNTQDEESLTYSDTAHARFERLLTLMEADPEAAGWWNVGDPDTDLASAGIGAMIQVECDVYIPDVIRAMSQGQELTRALDAMDAMMPFAEILDLNVEGMPSKAERQAARGFGDFSKVLGGKLVAVGDIDESEWRVAGQLDSANLESDIDGRAKVVGKVASKWNKGQWKPLMALPGSSFLPREQRRKMERTKPQEGEEDNYLEGPALMLDILAIYR